MSDGKPQSGQRYKDAHGRQLAMYGVEYQRVTFYCDGYEHQCVQPLERFNKDYQLIAGGSHE